jgi:hypothetical protein
MSSLVVVEQLQAYLVAQGVAQLPGAAPSLTKPSVWTMPRQGAPVPRMKDGNWLETQTVTLNDLQLMGPPGLETWLEDAFVDITVRSRNAAEGKLLHRTIRGLLHPVGGNIIGKGNWTMGTLPVLYSSVWRSEQALPPREDGLTYDRLASYRFRCARSVLAA